MNKLQRVFYRLSGHKSESNTKTLNVEVALQAMYEKGIRTGESHAQPRLIEKRVCRKHEMVLLIEMEIGRYFCPVCEEERHTGPIQQMHPMMTIYNDARRGGAGTNTALQKTIKLTQKLKGEQE